MINLLKKTIIWKFKNTNLLFYPRDCSCLYAKLTDNDIIFSLNNTIELSFFNFPRTVCQESGQNSVITVKLHCSCPSSAHSTSSTSMVATLLGTFYCADLFCITSISLCLPQGSCMKWKHILPVGKCLIFVQLARAAWKDLELFWQLNNVNLKPINILLGSGWGRYFQRLSRAESGIRFLLGKLAFTMCDPENVEFKKTTTMIQLFFLEFKYLSLC